MDTKKDIVLINQSSGYLMVDIANAFVKAGYNVTLIAGKINCGYFELDLNIKVKKITEYNRLSIIKRLISWITGFVEIVSIVRKDYSNSELLIVSNPPIALFLPLFTRNKYNFLIFDVYVETLQRYALLREKSPLVYIWKLLHKYVLKRAKTVFVLTKSMKQVLSKYSKRDIEILSIWGDKVNQINNKYNGSNIFDVTDISGKFIMLYTGNIGKESGVGTIIEIAKNFKNDDSIMFLFVGDGILKQKYVKMALELNLKNCIFLSFLNYVDFQFVLSVASMSIVSLSDESSAMSIPSKTFNYISSGIPVLCIANVNSEIYSFIKENNVGSSFNHDEIDNICTLINRLMNNPTLLDVPKNNAVKLAKLHSNENAVKLVSVITYSK